MSDTRYVIRVAVTEIDDENVNVDDVLMIQVSEPNTNLPLMVTLAQEIVQKAMKDLEKKGV